MHRGQPRLRYLDGLRGLAIILVMLWHYLSWTYVAQLPFGDRYAALPVVRNGAVGVEIFFLISGFVIFMTIERCSGVVDFLLRRWLRLFPAMLVASLLLFAIDRTMHPIGPFSGPRPIDLVPGLLLIAPAILHALLHVDFRSLDGVFWTLYAEAAFYVIFGLLYFRFGWQRAVAGLVLLAAGVRIADIVLPLLHAPPLLLRALEPFSWVGVPLFAWFASGALFYKAKAADDRRLFALAVATGFVAVALFDVPLGVTPESRAYRAGAVLLFAAVQAVPLLQRLFALRPLLFVGFISYPLYLVHNNLGIGIMRWIAAFLPAAPPIVAIAGAALATALLAWAIATSAEPWLARLLRPGVDHLRRAAGVRPS